MKFGIWVEPEMINPDSDLYRAHPDWVMNFPGRPRTEARNQLVLNMARDDVREHIFTVLDRLLSENDIAFFKWDMNRHFSEPGWPEQGPDDAQKKIWVAVHAQRVRHHRPAPRETPGPRDRELLGRRRPRRPGDPAARRADVDLRQYRRPQPDLHPVRLYVRLRAARNGGLGHRRAELRRPFDAAEVPVRGGDDGHARDRRRT